MKMDTATFIFLVTLATTTVDKVLDKFYPNSKVRGLIDLMIQLLGGLGKHSDGK
jgi:hypothetical protein